MKLTNRKEVKDQLNEANSWSENEVTALNENLNVLSTIKQNIYEDDDKNSCREVIDMI